MILHNSFDHNMAINKINYFRLTFSFLLIFVVIDFQRIIAIRTLKNDNWMTKNLVLTPFLKFKVKNPGRLHARTFQLEVEEDVHNGNAQ